VSLLAMLEFAAAKFVEISHRFGLLLGAVNNRTLLVDPDILEDTYSDLITLGSHLGLAVTTKHLINLFGELHSNAPADVQEQNKERIKRGELIISGEMTHERAAHHVESIYSTMLAELGSMLFRAIPKERAIYWEGWLSGTDIGSKFHTSATELERAGRCYALGEATACVFHSMRALEPGLGALAEEFRVSAAHENWQNIINDIEAAIRELGKLPKNQQKLEDEKFFGAAVSHLYFVKNAWRNHVNHMRDSYSDGEAKKVLDRSKDFIESLCPRLQEN
jgi:hypothetical protein